jgi:hypothetical protein
MAVLFVCPDHQHPITTDDDGCPWCVIDLLTRPDPATMTGRHRAEEVRELLNRPSTTRLVPVWRRIDRLLGRPTMNHELADAERLAAEAADWSGRGGWERRAIESLCDRVGAERVFVVDPGGEGR